jgi:hypothetical protein
MAARVRDLRQRFTSPSGIDMHPHLVLLAQVSDLLERIEGSQNGCSYRIALVRWNVSNAKLVCSLPAVAETMNGKAPSLLARKISLSVGHEKQNE